VKTLHIRFDDSRPAGSNACVCGEPGCTRWFEEARPGPARHSDREAMDRRLREAEGGET
jgi:hypothetical protein